MTINCLWNKRSGPGGGTRRLHHKMRGRNRIDTRNKDKTFVRHCSAVIGLKLINANSNVKGKANVVNANRFGGQAVAMAA